MDLCVISRVLCFLFFYPAVRLAISRICCTHDKRKLAQGVFQRASGGIEGHHVRYLTHLLHPCPAKPRTGRVATRLWGHRKPSCSLFHAFATPMTSESSHGACYNAHVGAPKAIPLAISRICRTHDKRNLAQGVLQRASGGIEGHDIRYFTHLRHP